jgi:DNA-binding response OmpR family regulator
MDKELINILKSSSLLFVEDDTRIRSKFIRLLGFYVNKIYEASDGEKALEIYKKNRPSFIISDIEMQGMNGLKFIEILKKENEIIPIIITSAYSNKDYLLFSIKLHLTDYLIKPIVYDELLSALEKVAIILKKTTLQNIIKISEGIFYNPLAKAVNVNDVVKTLTFTEYKLLELLLLNRRNIVTKEMVENNIYIFKEMSNTALKNVVYKLRKKIEKDLIIRVDKVGYKID